MASWLAKSCRRTGQDLLPARPVTGFIQCASGPSRRALSTSTSSASHYDKLKLSRTATKAQVKAKFYELSKKHHPDAPGGSASRFHEINDAYSVLGNESKRQQYDQSIAAKSNPQSGWSPQDPTSRTGGQGPHRAWGGSHRRAPSSRPPPQQPPQYPYYNTFGGRRVPPSFGSASHHPHMRRSGATGPMGDGYPHAPGMSTPPMTVKRGESAMWRFLMTAGLVMTVVWLGGGFTASSESAIHHTGLLETITIVSNSQKPLLNECRDRQRRIDNDRRD